MYSKGSGKCKNKVFVFHPNEILKEEKKSGRFFKGISSKKKSGKYSPYFMGVSDMWKDFKRRIIGGAVTAALLCGICLGANALDLRLGYEVIIDGEAIGLVTDKDSVFDAIEGVKGEMEKYTGDASYSKSPAFVLRIVSESNIASTRDIKEHLLSHLDYMVDCVGIYVDENPVLGVTSEDAAQWVLEKHKQSEVSEEAAQNAETDFVEKVEVKKGHLHISMLRTPEEALELLSGEKNQKETEYIVKADDTLWGIAKCYGLSVERLLALNEGIGDNIKEGDSIKLEAAVPLISVRTVRNAEYIEETPYGVEKIEDESLYENTTVVSRQGKNGETKIVAKITEVNGVETAREVLSSSVVSEPLSRIEKVGTKKRPPTTGSGTFINPSFGSLSSRFGSRWGRNHNGIDIAGSYNSNIKAADGGIVTYAGWMDGYGNYVVINHENGYQTGYGHCASLSVKVGQRVAKGDIIAKMGNTGRSTGTHLHFEVKKDGVYQNPLNYVGY